MSRKISVGCQHESAAASILGWCQTSSKSWWGHIDEEAMKQRERDSYNLVLVKRVEYHETWQWFYVLIPALWRIKKILLPAAVKNIGKCKTVNQEHFSSGFKRGGNGEKKKQTRKRENKEVLEYVIHSGRNYGSFEYQICIGMGK